MRRQRDTYAEYHRQFAEDLYTALVSATSVTVCPRFWNPERVYPEGFTEVMERVSPQEVREWHVSLPIDPQVAYELAYDDEASWLALIQEDVPDIVRRIIDGMKEHFDKLPYKGWYDLIGTIDLSIDIATGSDDAEAMRVYETIWPEQIGISERIYDTRKEHSV